MEGKALETEGRELLRRVEEQSGSGETARRWFYEEPLPGFGDATSDQLVREGKAEWVHEHLDRILAGGHA